MENNINRKQFLGSLLAGATLGCLPAFSDSRLNKSEPTEFEPTEFEKCRNDILYFVDNYLEVNDRHYGKLKMSPQQREYLKRISTAPDFFFCAKGRQIGISTANNVFAYWKSIFFGPDHHVFIVEPHLRMKEDAKNLYWDVSNSGAFMPLPNRVHFITPRTMMAHDLTDENHTYILDEFEFWDEHSLDRLSKSHLDRFLLNSVYARELSPEKMVQFKAHMIVPSSVCSYDSTFATLINNVDDSRRLVLPSPERGLKA
jgi:hypothetical protein